ncbi:MAG: hypothetical protein KAI66_17890 [Lentisphaeria bacterium]|nr:hypothetical protein [Lentisphaeria bacterium]
MNLKKILVGMGVVSVILGVGCSREPKASAKASGGERQKIATYSLRPGQEEMVTIDATGEITVGISLYVTSSMLSRYGGTKTKIAELRDKTQRMWIRGLPGIAENSRYGSRLPTPSVASTFSPVGGKVRVQIASLVDMPILLTIYTER